MPTNFSTVQYYNAGWQTESQWAKLTVIESVGKVKTAEIVIVDPRNQKQNPETYPAYRRIRILERNTDAPIFHGRVEFVEPYYDASFGGQCLRVVAKSFLQDLKERLVNADYSNTATFTRRSEVIGAASGIIQTYRAVAGNITVGANLEASVRTFAADGGRGPDLRGSHVDAFQAIVELASSDCTTVGEAAADQVGYDFFLGEIETTGQDHSFFYWPRGSYWGLNKSTEVMDAVSGLTVAYSEAQADQVRAMMGDYYFPKFPKEIVTRVTIHYTGTDEQAESYTTVGGTILGDGVTTQTGLETALGIVKEFHVYRYDIRSDAEAQNVAIRTLRQQAWSSTIQRAECNIINYPYYIRAGTTYLVRPGHRVHVHNTNLGIDADYILLESRYEEPPSITHLTLVEAARGYGKANTFSVPDMTRQLDDKSSTGIYQSPASAGWGQSSVSSWVPAVPVGVNAIQLDTGQLQVFWNTSSDADLFAYDVYRGENVPPGGEENDVNYTFIQRINTTVYTDDITISGTYDPTNTYRYKVKAIDFNRNESATSVSAGPYASGGIKARGIPLIFYDAATLLKRVDEYEDNAGDLVFRMYDSTVIYPYTDSSYDLGKSTRKWNNIYVVTASFTTVGATTGNITNINATTVGASTGNITTLNTTTGNITTVNATTVNTTDVVMANTGRVYASSGVIGFSTVSGILTLGSLGSVIIPYGDFFNAANDTARDALAGNFNGAIGVDSVGDGGGVYYIWVRHNGLWQKAALG